MLYINSLICFPVKVEKKIFGLIPLFLALSSIVSCSDDTGSIGGKIMPSNDEPNVTQGVFSVFTRSVKVDSVLGTTSTSYLGKITDPETNATTYCDFLGQFHTLENISFPDRSVLVQDNGKPEADSVEIRLYISSYYGDSLNSMKLGVYELDTNNVMKENMSYYSNIDPQKYVSKAPSAIRKITTFSVVNMALSDSLKNVESRNRNIRISLPRQYGTFLMNKYYSDPANYSNSYNFIHHVCPGFYYKLISGDGTMLSIDNATLSVYFRYFDGDSVVDGVQRMAATEEVLQNTRVENKNIDKLLNTQDCSYLKTPVGIFTEVTLPIDSIFAGEHVADTINSARISFVRINDSKLTEYNLPLPQQLLMVKSDDIYSFFENSRVADGLTSFVTSYSASDNAYDFSNISSLVSNMYSTRMTGAGVKSTDSEAEKTRKYTQWEAMHPAWNKVMLIPVTTNYSQQSNGYTTQKVLTRVRNDLSLTSTRLVGGNTGDVKISVIYSRFNK